MLIKDILDAYEVMCNKINDIEKTLKMLRPDDELLEDVGLDQRPSVIELNKIRRVLLTDQAVFILTELNFEIEMTLEEEEDFEHIIKKYS